MGEILLPACQFPRLSDGAICRDIQPQALCQACTAHVQVAALRARLESAERALKVLEGEFGSMGPAEVQEAMTLLRAALGAAGEKERWRDG
jgi:hypothetical protein